MTAVHDIIRLLIEESDRKTQPPRMLQHVTSENQKPGVVQKVKKQGLVAGPSKDIYFEKQHEPAGRHVTRGMHGNTVRHVLHIDTQHPLLKNHQWYSRPGDYHEGHEYFTKQPIPPEAIRFK